MIKKLWHRFLSYFPSVLPKGGTEFDKFSASIFEIYSLPTLPSYQQAVASMIMHLGTQTTRKSKRYFAKGIQKAMANQVAYDKIQQIRDKEKLKESQKEEAQANEPQG